MSRTTVEIQMRTDNINAVYNIIANKLYLNGYKEGVIKGENVWSKGDGVVIKMQCFNINFIPGKVILQAWMKDALTGESSLKGFVAIVLKKNMKKLIESIENEIQYNYL